MKKGNINNLISRAKLISSSKRILHRSSKIIKQTVINNGFPNYIVDEQIKCTLKNISPQNKQCNTLPNKQAFIKLFYCNQMN